MRPSCPHRSTFLLALAAAAIPAMAATYRMPPDDVLVRKTPVIARGHVMGEASLRGGDGGIYTDFTVAVERVLKGSDVASTIVIRQPGGLVDSEGEYYPGIGTLDPGESVLLMLTPKQDGRFGLTDFALGKFHVGRASDGTEFLRRDGLESSLTMDGGGAPSGSALASPDPDRDASGFERFVVGIVHGLTPPIDYIREPQIEADREAGFTYLGEDTHSPPARRLEFDSGTTIQYTANPAGDPGAICIYNNGCLGEVAAGMVTWNSATGSKILLAYGGTDPAITGKCKASLHDQIQFDDPCGEITDLSDQCTGTLAVSGFTYTTLSGGNPSCSAKGNPSFYRILAARILVNNDVGDCLEPCEYQKMIAHETGHTIGAGHSADSTALMYEWLTGSDCGVLLPDDVAFAQCFYPACKPMTATRAVPIVRRTFANARIFGTGFPKGARVEFNSGNGWTAASKSVRKSKLKIVAQYVQDIWPVGVPTLIHVVAPDGCISTEFTATR